MRKMRSRAVGKKKSERGGKKRGTVSVERGTNGPTQFHVDARLDLSRVFVILRGANRFGPFVDEHCYANDFSSIRFVCRDSCGRLRGLSQQWFAKRSLCAAANHRASAGGELCAADRADADSAGRSGASARAGTAGGNIRRLDTMGFDRDVWREQDHSGERDHGHGAKHDGGDFHGHECERHERPMEAGRKTVHSSTRP
jgi:hypothetical protein